MYFRSGGDEQRTYNRPTVCHFRIIIFCFPAADRRSCLETYCKSYRTGSVSGPFILFFFFFKNQNGIIAFLHCDGHRRTVRPCGRITCSSSVARTYDRDELKNPGMVWLCEPISALKKKVTIIDRAGRFSRGTFFSAGNSKQRPAGEHLLVCSK